MNEPRRDAVILGKRAVILGKRAIVNQTLPAVKRWVGNYLNVSERVGEGEGSERAREKRQDIP